MLAVLLLGCAPTDACDAMCDAGASAYEACLPEWGLEWGDAYDDAADWWDWCETWSWELRQLGEADTCADVEQSLVSGDCTTYASAWERP